MDNWKYRRAEEAYLCPLNCREVQPNTSSSLLLFWMCYNNDRKFPNALSGIAERSLTTSSESGRAWCELVFEQNMHIAKTTTYSWSKRCRCLCDRYYNVILQSYFLPSSNDAGHWGVLEILGQHLGIRSWLRCWVVWSGCHEWCICDNRKVMIEVQLHRYVSGMWAHYRETDSTNV